MTNVLSTVCYDAPGVLHNGSKLKLHSACQQGLTAVPGTLVACTILAYWSYCHCLCLIGMTMQCVQLKLQAARSAGAYFCNVAAEAATVNNASTRCTYKSPQRRNDEPLCQHTCRSKSSGNSAGKAKKSLSWPALRRATSCIHCCSLVSKARAWVAAENHGRCNGGQNEADVSEPCMQDLRTWTAARRGPRSIQVRTAVPTN
jgi:hypothetical protein